MKKIALILLIFTLSKRPYSMPEQSCLKSVEKLLNQGSITSTIKKDKSGKIIKVSKTNQQTKAQSDLPESLLSILNLLDSNLTLKEKEKLLEDITYEIYEKFYHLKAPVSSPNYLKDNYSDLNKFKFPYQVFLFHREITSELINAPISDSDYHSHLENIFKYLVRFILEEEVFYKESKIYSEFIKYRDKTYKHFSKKYKDMIHLDPREPSGH